MDEGSLEQIHEWTDLKRWKSLAKLRERLQVATNAYEKKVEELEKICPDDCLNEVYHGNEEVTHLQDIMENLQVIEGGMTKPYWDAVAGLVEVYDAGLLEGLPEVDSPPPPIQAAAKVETVLRRLKGARTPPLPPADSPDDDDTAYVPASTLWMQRFDTYKKFKVALDKIPAEVIRRRNPSPQRLEIHAADWAHYWSSRDDEAFELMDAARVGASLADAAAAVRRKRRK